MPQVDGGGGGGGGTQLNLAWAYSPPATRGWKPSVDTNPHQQRYLRWSLCLSHVIIKFYKDFLSLIYFLGAWRGPMCNSEVKLWCGCRLTDSGRGTGWLSKNHDENLRMRILLVGILNWKFCTCADSRRYFWTTNMKTVVALEQRLTTLHFFRRS